MKKDIKDYTKEDFLEIPSFNSEAEFDSVIIVPTGELHDSEFEIMKFILVRDWEIVGAINRGSDVVHINGIGGYGKDWEKVFMNGGLIKASGWCIDCLPGSGCLRLFVNRVCKAGSGFSDFEIIAEN